MYNLENVKAGDKVLKFSRYAKIPTVAIVQEVTKAKNLKVDGAIYFPSGSERTSDRYPVYHIAPFSQEEIDEATANQNAEKFSNEVLNRVAKLKSDYSHSGYLSSDNAKILDAALKEIGY